MQLMRIKNLVASNPTMRPKRVRNEVETTRRELRRHMRIGRFALFCGLLTLAACSALRSLLSVHAEPLARFFSEGLLILSWVALWRPIEMLMFERRKARDERRRLELLAAVPIAFVYSRE